MKHFTPLKAAGKYAEGEADQHEPFDEICHASLRHPRGRCKVQTFILIGVLFPRFDARPRPRGCHIGSAQSALL